MAHSCLPIIDSKLAFSFPAASKTASYGLPRCNSVADFCGYFSIGRSNWPSLSAISSTVNHCCKGSISLFHSPKPLTYSSNSPASMSTAATGLAADASTAFHGECYVVGDNIDTDQIIPAEYLTLVPSKPDEYEKLGSYALIGLPSSYETRFIEAGATKSRFKIVIAGDNFGCGSSREHAPVALGASGVAVVVAESYARIFFRNSVATGEIYPLESEGRLCEECRTGDLVTIELTGSQSKLVNHTSGKEYNFKPIGDAGPVIEAGGIFAYARKTGMIPPGMPKR